MRPVPSHTLTRWRTLSASTVLVVVADHAKPDPTYVPSKNSLSTRWHVSAGGNDFELILTGPKFWDTRQCLGGGGAIDLVKHLFRMSFKQAVGRLRALKV